MTTNYIDATDSMYDLFLTGFKEPAKELLGYIPEIRWRNKEEKAKPPTDKFWCRVSVFTEDEEQTNVSVVRVDEKYIRRYTTYGVIIIQIFCPKSVKNSDKLGQKLSNISKLCFRGKKADCGIIFRNSRINDGIPPEELFYRFNVISDFEYDEIA